MTFLNPAILFGLLAATIPVVIHLLNLRKLKIIEFSTLSFLKELQKNKIRRVKLKQWLLLALRVLIILLIVTVFARPTLEGVNIGGTASATKTTAIFVLDDTFSMSVINQKGSYLNQAKQVVKNIIKNLEDGDEAALLLLSGNTNEEVGLTSNLQILSDHLETILVSGSTGTLNAVLVRAANIIGESKNFNKEIYLLTDFQINRVALDENIIDLGQLLNNQVKLYSFDFSDREINNISIDNLEVKTKIFEKNKPVSFEATITNYSNQPVLNLVTSLFVDSKRSAQKSIDFQPEESKNILLESTVDKQGQVDVFLEIEDDEIAEDNKRYISVKIPDRISVLLLYDNVDDAKFVNLALQSSRSDENLDVTLIPLESLKSVQLEDYNIVILISSVFDTALSNLKKFVNKGGGLVIYPSSTAKLEGFRAVLNPFEVTLPDAFIESDLETSFSTNFDEVNAEHPLLQNIFKDENKKEIESPEIYKYFRIVPGGEGTSIIKLLDGSTFLCEYNSGKGKILVYDVSPVVEWSDFPVKSIFAPLVFKSVIYLSSGGNGGSKIFAGEPINFNISNRVVPQIKIISPDKSEEFIKLKESNNDFIQFTKTFSTGNYKIFSGDILLETASVNTDPVESNVSYIQDAVFDDYLKSVNFKGYHFRIPKEASPTEAILQSRFGSELWRYFLIVVFLLTLIEMAVARAAKKELVGIEK